MIAHKEHKKISKIIDELSLYFLKHDIREFDMNVLNDSNTYSITFSIKKIDHSLLDKLYELINQEREIEVEEYGWELMGESDCENELELIGLLIDSFTYEYKEEKYFLRFIRKS